MTAWRLAETLKVLQAEVNTAYPDRPKTADGTIGDARHQAEQSDHNPNPPHPGVVTAWDITTDGFTIALAETLRQMGKAGDQRVKYVIYRGRITSAQHSWEWAPYSGSSQHFDHIHLSVADDPAHYDSRAPWGVFVHGTAASNPTPTTEEHEMTAAEHLALVETRKIAEANGKLLGEILAELKQLNAK
jgi:hypothetical protein